MILDSFTLHYRTSDLNFNDKNRIINTLCTDLLKLTQEYRVAVMMTNMIKTKRVAKDQPPRKEPLFGEVLFQSVTNRIMLKKLREKDLGTERESLEAFSSHVFRLQILKASLAKPPSQHEHAYISVSEAGISIFNS